MANQPPVKNNANNSLLSDADFTHLHQAFLLGWSITELKSRVQIAACSKAQLSNIIKPPDGTQAALQNSTAGTQDAPQKHGIDALIKEIILADLSDITTNKIVKRVGEANGLPSNSLSTDLSDKNWLASILRAIFNRIVALHVNRFPASTTKNTIYDLGDITDASNRYGYLFPPAGKDDYTSIGIALLAPTGNPNLPATGGNQSGGVDASPPAFVQDFKLYDATRRAINCLTLLLTKAEDSILRQGSKGRQMT